MRTHLLLIICLLNISYQLSTKSAKPLAERTAEDFEYRALTPEEVVRYGGSCDSNIHYFGAIDQETGLTYARLKAKRGSVHDFIRKKIPATVKDEDVAELTITSGTSRPAPTEIVTHMLPLALKDIRARWPEVKFVYIYKSMQYSKEVYENAGFRLLTSAKGFPWYAYGYPSSTKQAVSEPTTCGMRVPGVHIDCYVKEGNTINDAKQHLVDWLPSLTDDIHKLVSEKVVSKASAYLQSEIGKSVVGQGSEMGTLLSALQQIKDKHPDLTFAVVSMRDDPTVGALPDSPFEYIGQDPGHPGNKLYIYKYSPIGNTK